jgi:hypothetical protein
VQDKLFVSQSDHGIDPHCSPRRKVASQGGEDAQQNRDACKGPRVCSPHAIKQALQVARSARCYCKTDNYARQRKREAKSRRQPQDFLPPRANRLLNV